MAIKWNFNTKYDFNNKNFQKIIDFYVIKCPVKAISCRGISFKERHIELKSLIGKIKKSSDEFSKNWDVIDTNDLVKVLTGKKIYANLNKIYEFGFHTKSSNLGKLESLFYAIRCAFAHGSFAIHKCNGKVYYLLENTHKGDLKGRICIKEDTLLDFIKIIEVNSQKN